jgi:diacylglycerol kinase (ATP)
MSMTAVLPERRMRDLVIVANPAAAAVTGPLIEHVGRRLGPLALRSRTVWTERRGHAADFVRHAPDGAIVVAVGGDGTVAEVVSALADAPEREQLLLVLPGGSGNSSSRNLWGDLELDGVLDLLTTAGSCRVRWLDLLRLAEPAATVLLGASSGFLAEVLVRARVVDPVVTGIQRYYAAAAGVLQAMPDTPTRVSVDGRVLYDGPTSSVTVGGGRFRARSFNFLPDSVLDDGLLDVSTIAALDATALRHVLPLIPTGEHLARPEVRYARGRSAVIERTDGAPLVVEFDGEVWDAAGPRLTVDVLPAAVRALVPAVAPCG